MSACTTLASSDAHDLRQWSRREIDHTVRVRNLIDRGLQMVGMFLSLRYGSMMDIGRTLSVEPLKNLLKDLRATLTKLENAS